MTVLMMVFEGESNDCSKTPVTLPDAGTGPCLGNCINWDFVISVTPLEDGCHAMLSKFNPAFPCGLLAR